MARFTGYLPDDLYDEAKRRNLPLSALTQVAVRAELARLDALEATDAHLADLIEETGEPTAADREFARRVTASVRMRRAS